MKLVGKYLRSLFNQNGELEVTFKVNNHYHVRQAQQLNSDDNYKMDISVVKQKRSLEQNRFMWALLHQLEIVTQEDSMLWYIKALEESNAKCDYLMGIPEVQERLQTVYRAVKVVDTRFDKDIKTHMYKCFYGSSKFTVEEMTLLIETIMRYCVEHNIDTELYKYEEVK